MSKSIALILPAYNESLSIKKTLLEFHNLYPDLNIFVIDNNSDDDTQKISKETYLEYKISGKIIYEPKKGKANAIRTAFREIDADIYVMCDSDHTYFAEDLKKLIDYYKKNKYDIIIGDRISSGAYANQNKRFLHLFGNRFLSGIINFLYQSKINDLTSGYRVLSKEFVKLFPILSKGFEIETEMVIHALECDYKIIEIQISYRKRAENSFSKLNTFKDGIKIINIIFRYFKNYKPLKFFGFLSFIFLVLTILFGSIVLIDYLEDSFIEKVPLAILSASLGLLTLLLFISGLILDSISEFNKFNYEIKRQFFRNK